MLGAYYEAHTLDPIGALGNVSGQASLAHEAIREFLAGPIGRFAPWAEQTVDGYNEVVTPEYNYSIFPIGANTLRAAEQKAVGNPVGVVGILFRAPAPLEEVDKLFGAGPYELFQGEVVYRVDDDKAVPTPQFLYLGKLYDEGTHDGLGTYEAMDAAIKAAGGRLVFALPYSPSGMETSPPAGTVYSAINATMTDDVPAGPIVTTPEEYVVPAEVEQFAPGEPVPGEPLPEPLPASASAPARSSSLYAGVVGFIGLVGGAALGYYAVRRTR